jgi:hypothetical protein
VAGLVGRNGDPTDAGAVAAALRADGQESAGEMLTQARNAPRRVMTAGPAGDGAVTSSFRQAD